MMGYIDSNGQYRKGEPDTPMAHDVSSQWKSWSHMEQKKRFGADIIQPFINGEVNREFVEVYRGEVADRYYTKEQQDAADRKLGGL